MSTLPLAPRPNAGFDLCLPRTGWRFCKPASHGPVKRFTSQMRMGSDSPALEEPSTCEWASWLDRGKSSSAQP